MVTETETKLRTDVASKSAGRGNNASFDFDFLRLTIKLVEQAIELRHHSRNVRDDDSIGAIVRYDFATAGDELLHGSDDIFRVRIAEEAGDRDFFDGHRLGRLFRGAVVSFFAQRIHRCDAQNIAFELTREFVVLQDDVQRLVPRHIVEDDGQGSVHIRIKNDVQSADLVNEAEEVFQ